MTLDFTLDITPPTVTAQQHKVAVVKGRPRFYDGQELKNARALFMWTLRQHAPAEPLTGAVALTVDWIFATKSHKEGEWRVTRPDTDNLQKLFKDCMTKAGYWNDDSQVCVETITKRWSRSKPGIHVSVREI